MPAFSSNHAARATASAVVLLLGSIALASCAVEAHDEEHVGSAESAIHSGHSGPPPWTHVLTCYGGCQAPHYDASACGHATSCGPIADGTWWYSTERAAFYCGARLQLVRGDKCVVVDVEDNGPADWVEANAASQCGTGYIIDASPLVADYFGGGCGWGECFTVDVSPVPDGTPTGPCEAVTPENCTSSQADACANYGCACVDGQCNGGFCAGDGCTDTSTNNCAAFGCGCVDGKCSGGFCDGGGCTAKEAADCSAFGCNCVDHQCAGGFCPGTGCTAKDVNNCGAFGCGCVDHQCAGGSCPGKDCTAKEQMDCTSQGCDCAGHQCTGCGGGSASSSSATVGAAPTGGGSTANSAGGGGREPPPFVSLEHVTPETDIDPTSSGGCSVAAAVVPAPLCPGAVRLLAGLAVVAAGARRRRRPPRS